MAVEPQSSPDGVSVVARQRAQLTGRQKVGIFVVLGALALVAIFVSQFFRSGSKPEPDTAASAIDAGMPFAAPPAPRTIASPPRPLPTPYSGGPVLPHLVPNPPKDMALDSPIFSYAGGGAGDDNGALARLGKDGGAGAKDDLSAALTPSDLGGPARARMLPHPALTIPAGTVIPCILQTAINSELKGFVDCVIPSEVRGATGTVTLLDRGTQIFGEIRSGLQQGQDRLFILWVRARTPDNVVISLDSPGADELGRSGVPGYVNNHFWQRFGAAILFSVIDYGPQIASSALEHGNGNSYIQFMSPQQQLANTVLDAQINIPPTLEKNQGETVSIFTARDLDFSSVFSLEAAQ